MSQTNSQEATKTNEVEDTTRILLAVLSAWAGELGKSGCVPLVLIGLRPDGKHHYVTPPLEWQPLEELAGSLEAVLARVRVRIKEGRGVDVASQG